MQIKEQMIRAFEAANIHFYHIKAPTEAQCPLCIWYETDSSNLFADDKVWQVNKGITIDLLTIEDPTETCEDLENALTSEGICWQSGGPVWDDKESLYVCQYWF